MLLIGTVSISDLLDFWNRHYSLLFYWAWGTLPHLTVLKHYRIETEESSHLTIPTTIYYGQTKKYIVLIWPEIYHLQMPRWCLHLSEAQHMPSIARWKLMLTLQTTSSCLDWHIERSFTTKAEEIHRHSLSTLYFKRIWAQILETVLQAEYSISPFFTSIFAHFQKKQQEAASVQSYFI